MTLGFAGSLLAQPPPPRPIEPKPNLSTDPILHSFSFRSIGPAVMSGRLDDIQGTAKDPMLLWIGFATGGVWKSTDGGNHWKSQFDEMPYESIGAIGIAPSDPNVVYVGTGEANNRQSSTIGDGIWGTTDGGKTWAHLGLEDSQSINRIVVDPTNPKIVYVAVPGHLFGPNPERGLYKTTDGGKTWKNLKFIDQDTGFNDVAIDPANPKIIYATSFQRRRNGWGYNGGGPNGALWKSTNSGDTWTKLDGPGWPKPTDGLYGRIAITIFPGNSKIIFAQVEAGHGSGTGSGTTIEGGPVPPGYDSETPPPPAGYKPKLDKDGKVIPPPPDVNGNGIYRSDDAGKTWVFVSDQNQRPTYFAQIRVDPKNVNKLFVGGTPGQMSLDGGKTWKGLTGSHTDYHAIWINPVDPRIVAVGHDGGLDISNDGGFTWDYHNDMALGLYYQVSADNRHPYFVCGGLQDNNAWCGPSALRSSTGPVNTDWYTIAGGDGFYTRQDPLDWTIIYGESQDGNMSRHNLRNATQKPIKPNVTVPTPPKPPADAAKPDAAKPDGAKPGDATKPASETPASTPAKDKAAPAKPAVDEAAATPANENPTPTNPTATNPTAGSAPAEAPPAGSPPAGGRRGRGGAGAPGTPGAPGATTATAPEAPADFPGFPRSAPNVSNAPKGVPEFRFYWNAPMEISPYDPSVIYMAAQYFFKSTNRGDSWTMNPTDLTKNLPRWDKSRDIMGVSTDKPMVAKHDGYASSSLATQVRESPSKPGVLWIGTDDGNLQVSQDDGQTFTNVYGNISGAPQGYVQIERIEPSHFDPGTAYVALNNHRNDDFKPYLFKTTDYGKSWTNVSGNLPTPGSINALREDLENPNLLFIGTEFSMFVTLDGGKTYQKFMNGMPSVRVDDILIHPRERDLIVGTHGRSIWIMDDISPLEHMQQAEKEDVFLFTPRSAVLWKNDIQAQRHVANREFVGENPQGGTAIHVFSKTDLGKAKVEFLQGTKVVSTMDIDIKTGLNSYQWNMRGPAPAANANRRPGGGGPPTPREMVPNDPNAPTLTPEQTAAQTAAQAALVPFAGGGFGGGFGRRNPVGPLLEPGTYMIHLTVGGKTLTSSVDILEDQWLTQQ
jgi:photosystem II stability/assembly factor-like uncharacterized protein